MLFFVSNKLHFSFSMPTITATLLSDDDLKEMGVNVVGDRLMIKHSLKDLKRTSRFNKRMEAIWEGTEQIFFNDSEQSAMVRYMECGCYILFW